MRVQVTFGHCRLKEIAVRWPSLMKPIPVSRQIHALWFGSRKRGKNTHTDMKSVVRKVDPHHLIRHFHFTPKSHTCVINARTYSSTVYDSLSVLVLNFRLFISSNSSYQRIRCRRCSHVPVQGALNLGWCRINRSPVPFWNWCDWMMSI